MNIERILALADLIEPMEHTSLYDQEGFNMEDYEHDCGTPCCIAGWAAYSANPQKTSHYAYYEGKEWLDLSYAEAFALFWPFQGQKDRHKKRRAITPSQAARTLRHLAATGEVVWDLGEEPAYKPAWENEK